MKNLSPQEEQFIKESAEWFNKTVTKVKSRKDPYRETVMELMDELSGLVDDIDQSLFQLSRADENMPNFEYSSSLVVSAIKEKMQAFSHRLGFLAEDLAKDKNIKTFFGISSDDKPKDKHPKPKLEIAKQKPAEEMKVEKPTEPGDVGTFMSLDDMVDKLIGLMYNLEFLEANMNDIDKKVMLIKDRYSNKLETPIHGKTLKKRLIEIANGVKHLIDGNKTFISLKDELEHIASKKNEIIKNKSLTKDKYINLIKAYNIIISEEQKITDRYRIIYGFLSGAESDENLAPPTSIKEEHIVQQPQEEPELKEDEQPEIGSEGRVSGNVIIKGASYTAVVDTFLQKYASKPSTYQKFVTALNTMLMHLNSTFFSDKAGRILKFRESLLTLKTGIVDIMKKIRQTSGVQGDPQKEMDRWDAVINEYNKFAKLYNRLIHTDISSRLSSLNQDLRQGRALSISPQSMMSKNTFDTATRSAKSNYQPAKFVINELPKMETLIKQYVDSGKIWGMKNKPIV